MVAADVEFHIFYRSVGTHRLVCWACDMVDIELVGSIGHRQGMPSMWFCTQLSRQMHEVCASFSPDQTFVSE
jgi:hypothetical protein